jgi:hypothetical protein
MSWLDGISGFSMAVFNRAFNWTREEIEAYLVSVRPSIKDRSAHAYHKIYVVWGRKPETTESAAVSPAPPSTGYERVMNPAWTESPAASHPTSGETTSTTKASQEAPIITSFEPINELVGLAAQEAPKTPPVSAFVFDTNAGFEPETAPLPPSPYEDRKQPPS